MVIIGAIGIETHQRLVLREQHLVVIVSAELHLNTSATANAVGVMAAPAAEK